MAGWKTFSAGSVLTASDVNGYLMDQVVQKFATSSARSSGIASPSKGMLSYLSSTKNVEVYNGTNWMGIGGMTLVSSGSFSGSASTNIANAFTTAYSEYLIITDFYSSTVQNALMTLTVAGVATGTWSSARLLAQANTGAPAFTRVFSSTASSVVITPSLPTGQVYGNAIIRISNPNSSSRKTITSISQGYTLASSGDPLVQKTQAWNSVSTACDGIQFLVATGTISGNYWIYGVRTTK